MSELYLYLHGWFDCMNGVKPRLNCEPYLSGYGDKYQLDEIASHE